MISRISGEATFKNLHIIPQGLLPSELMQKPRDLPMPGWSGYLLGVHYSDLGPFDVEVLTNADKRIQLLLLAHSHPLYEQVIPDDAERRAFHEGIINSELAGQREFSWGEVLCRFDKLANKDWLVLAYNQGPHVPMRLPEVLIHIHAHQI